MVAEEKKSTQGMKEAREKTSKREKEREIIEEKKMGKRITESDYGGKRKRISKKIHQTAQQNEKRNIKPY